MVYLVDALLACGIASPILLYAVRSIRQDDAKRQATGRQQEDSSWA